MTRVRLGILKTLMLGLTLLGSNSQALAFDKNQPAGFLWYNLPNDEKPKKVEKKIPFSSLSWQQKDKVLHYYTMEALHRARATHDVKDMERFLAIQHYWLTGLGSNGTANRLKDYIGLLISIIRYVSFYRIVNCEVVQVFSLNTDR